MSDEVKDEVKVDTFKFRFVFLKLKRISILKRKSMKEQGMKADEQKAMKVSPVRREDLVSGTSGTTSKKLMVGESYNCIICC